MGDDVARWVGGQALCRAKGDRRTRAVPHRARRQPCAMLLHMRSKAISRTRWLDFGQHRAEIGRIRPSTGRFRANLDRLLRHWLNSVQIQCWQKMVDFGPQSFAKFVEFHPKLAEVGLTSAEVGPTFGPESAKFGRLRQGGRPASGEHRPASREVGPRSGTLVDHGKGAGVHMTLLEHENRGQHQNDNER